MPSLTVLHALNQLTLDCDETQKMIDGARVLNQTCIGSADVDRHLDRKQRELDIKRGMIEELKVVLAAAN